ncbi:MAG: DMT family transporter [Alphaproteobacteria bacterium]
MSINQPVMNFQQWRAIFIISVIWSSSFVIYKAMGAVYQPLMIALIRCVIGASCLWVYCGYKKISLWHYKQYFPIFVIFGLLSNIIPFTLSGWLIKDVGAGVSAIIYSMNPILIALLVRFFYQDHRLSPLRFSGILVAVMGISVMMGVDAFLFLQKNDDNYFLKELALLMVAVSFAVQAVLVRKHNIKKIPAAVIVAGQNIFSVIILLPLVFLFDTPFDYIINPDGKLLLIVVIYNILSMGYAYGVYFNIIKQAGSVNGSMFAMFVPPLGVLYAFLFFDEKLLWNQLVGFLIVSIGLLLVDGRFFGYAIKKWQKIFL